MSNKIDRITEPQEWINGMLKEYAPNSKDIDVALQNMGLKIKELEAEIRLLRLIMSEGSHTVKGQMLMRELDK